MPKIKSNNHKQKPLKMTKSDLITANNLNMRIDDLNNLIDHIETDTKVRECKILNWNFDDQDDEIFFKRVLLTSLRKKRNLLQLKFNRI